MSIADEPEVNGTDEHESAIVAHEAQSSDVNPEHAGDEEEDDGTEEFDLGGKKYKLPREVKPHLLMQSDYTKKTQDLAEQRRAVEQQMAAIGKASDDLRRSEGRLATIDEAIEQYGAVDWDQLYSTDPQAEAHWRRYQQLKDQRGKEAAKVETTRRDFASQQHTATVKRHEETAKWAQTNIKGWDTGVRDKLDAYVTNELGYTAEDLAPLMSPRLVKSFYTAWLATQKPSSKPAASTPNEPAEAPRAPKTVSSGKSPARTALSDKMSAEDWAKARNEQVRRRNR